MSLIRAHLSRPLTAGLILTALLLAGCAQRQNPGLYGERDSTLSDARAQAQGRHGGAPTPSQLQLGFGDQEAPKQNGEAGASEQPVAAPTIRPLREPKTFLGTLPCPSGDPACHASRITLTLAPAGQWRARTQPLDASGNPAKGTADQGCWELTGTEPWRIALRSADKTASRASLTFVNDNQLRVNAVNGVTPTLTYQLTRQPDIDAISELDGTAVPQCR